mmetsp:Transcript_49217/g.145293  ORF Transcript_49217/g.145293 Transcript_49217/m.145293 type:complete len:249 (-) Transcript_49217:63-809(-)
MSCIDGAAIGRRQMAGNAANHLIHPEAPRLVRNHHKDNLKQMREKAAQLRGRKILESKAAAQPVELFKLRQFAAAAPRVYDARKPAAAQHGGYPPRRSAATGNAEVQTSAEEEELDLASFEAEVERLKREHGRPQPAEAGGFRKEADGVPAYLRKRQAEKEEKERMAEVARAAPRPPPGYRMMPQAEVQETLAGLKKKHAELEAQFRKLPLSIETIGQQQRQKEIMRKLEESQKYINTFSQPNVFVEA